MKAKIPSLALSKYYDEAREGYGRETEIGGNNTRMEITIFKDDFPGADKFASIFVTVNKFGVPIGHRLIPKGGGV